MHYLRFGWMVVLLGLALSGHATTDEQFAVVITQPVRDGVEVGREMDISGTAHIPDGHYLWILVHRRQGFSQMWWPQGAADIDVRTNAWTVRVRFGEARDVGYEFEILAVTVAAPQHRVLQAHWEQAMEKNDWRPRRLPTTVLPPVRRVVVKVSHD